MAVHLYGNVCNLDSLSELCDKYNLYLIEDCAEAIGSRYRGTTCRYIWRRCLI